MKKYFGVIFLELMIVVIYVLSVQASPTSKVTALVLDERGKPMEGVNVTIGYIIPRESGIGTNDKKIMGKTNKSGKFLASDESFAPQVTIRTEKDGYYRSSKIVKFSSRSMLFNRWEPWNTTIEVVLKKKRNPVPMYDNQRTSYKIPVFDLPIGFDLEKEDWVAPYGEGVIGDFVVKFNSEIREYSDYDCGFTLTFSNTHDGIQEYYFHKNDKSLYKWPFEAPVDGYKTQVIKKKSIALPNEGYDSNEKTNVNYIFRVRTKVDIDGNVIEANYGKLEGEFGFVPKGKITFRYYFNPDGTRNLEEDPEQNLFNKK